MSATTKVGLLKSKAPKQVYNSGGALSLDLILCQLSGLASKLVARKGRVQVSKSPFLTSCCQCHLRSQCVNPGLEDP